MVTMRFTKIEVQEILLWGKYHRERQEETGLAWDEQQEKIIQKLDKQVKA